MITSCLNIYEICQISFSFYTEPQSSTTGSMRQADVSELIQLLGVVWGLFDFRRERQIDSYKAGNGPTERSGVEEEEEEVTASGWSELRSDKHLVVHSHDEASSGVLSAAGCSHYSP